MWVRRLHLQLPTISTLLLLSAQGKGYTLRPRDVILRHPQRPSLFATPEELREKAAKLRREIQYYEDSKISDSVEQQSAAQPQRFADSSWRLTYRFIIDDNDSKNRETTTQSTGSESYGGVVTVKFLADGYTEIISQAASGSPGALISKAWGWDIEVSPEDGEEYLLFSMDFRLPSGTSDRRCYFQARHRQLSFVELSEGTVTIKQDVVQKASRWALFSPAGILAQFKFAGNFVAKPF